MGKIKCAHDYVLKSGRCYYCGEMTSFVNSQKAKIVTEPLEKKSTGPIEVSTSSQPLQEVAAAEDMAPDFATPNKRLAGGFLYSYEAGTVVPLPCYSDAALTTPVANPQILDDDGRLLRYYMLNQLYKFVLKDWDHQTMWEKDNVQGAPTVSTEMSSDAQLAQDTVCEDTADNSDQDEPPIDYKDLYIDLIGKITALSISQRALFGSLPSHVGHAQKVVFDLIDKWVEESSTKEQTMLVDLIDKWVEENSTKEETMLDGTIEESEE